MTRDISSQLGFPCVGKQLAGSVTELHNHEITFHRDSSHADWRFSPPFPLFESFPFSPCYKSHKEHPLSSKRQAMLSSQCLLPCKNRERQGSERLQENLSKVFAWRQTKCVCISRNIAKYIQPWPTVKAQAVEESKACRCIAYQHGKVTTRQGQSRPTTLPWESRK